MECCVVTRGRVDLARRVCWATAWLLVVLAVSCAGPEEAVSPSVQDGDLRSVERRLSEIEKTLDSRLAEKGVSSSNQLPRWEEGTTAAVTLEMLKGCIRLRLVRFMTDGEAEEVAEETVGAMTVTLATLKAYGVVSAEDDDVYFGLSGILFGCWDPPQSWLSGEG